MVVEYLLMDKISAMTFFLIFISFIDEQLIAIIFDVFVAGSETTSHTLGFALLLMIKYPAAQTRIQAEIDQILHGAPPSMIHRGRSVVLCLSLYK